MKTVYGFVHENRSLAQSIHKDSKRLPEVINRSAPNCERLDNKTSHETAIQLLPRENGVFYSLDHLTKKRQSLDTSEREEAQRLVNALNEACNQPTNTHGLQLSGIQTISHYLKKSLGMVRFLQKTVLGTIEEIRVFADGIRTIATDKNGFQAWCLYT